MVRQRLVNHRVAPVPVEPRGCLARYDRLADRLTVWLPTQRAHHTRWFVSQIVGVPEHRVRVVVPDVGGAFGSKEPMYPDEVAVTHAAIALGRPVKWVEDRSESFLATTHGRDQVADLEVAAERDGTITAIRGTIHADMGAYLYPNSSGTVLARTGPLLCGAYTISNIAVDIYGVFTNTTPLGPYRGAGRPEATYYIERLVDLVARALDLDPAEVRRRNFVGPGAFPYGTATGLTYDSGDYGAALDRALERVGYEDVRAEQRAGGTGGTRVGIGLSSYVEIGGVLPSRLAHLEGSPGLWETAVVRVHPTGALTVAVGTCDHGQGHATTFAQIVSDVLGVALGDIDVVYGDTDTAPFGFGTFGSRSAAVGGSAVHLACEKVRDKARQVAARMLESAVEDVECCQGSYFVRGSPARSLSFADIARESMLGVTDRGGETPGLDAEARFDPPNYTFSSGTHACVVEIDGETGLVRVRRYVAVDDCGRAINPMIVEGQIHGGIAQGVGQALLEEVR
ncbi:MAG: xanthine dehydrogenase family protein molybdopterin-binding subunit, partial [Acidimicrobiales bacterium]